MTNTSKDIDDFRDEFGPAKIVHLYDPSCNLQGVVVIDNTACGASVGGVRMATNVTTHEVFRLARAMTMKNAAAGLPHGGGKAGIIADPRTVDRPRVIRAFARAIRELESYIPGPDMGTNETCMAWIYDEIGRAVGLPRVLGGIPLDQIGATGFGVAQCGEVAAEFCHLELNEATMAIEGFGCVGSHAARHLAKMGVRLVAASDTQGTVYDPNGIDVQELIDVKEEKGSVVAYGAGEKLSKADLFTLPCDILIPSARPDVIHADNARTIQAKLILQGANIPATAEAEAILHQRGVLNLPDFIANAGGVICGSVEYHGGSEADVFEQIKDKIRSNTREVLSRSRHEQIEPRCAAMALARERLTEAMSYRCLG